MKTVFSLIFAGIFGATQVLLCPLAEANIWEKRQKSIEKSNQNLKLASFPSSLSGFKSNAPLEEQLPSIHTILPHHTSGKETSQINPSVFPNDFQTLIKAIPRAHGHIQEISFSEESHHPSVVLIQDIHLNPEAQFNISKIILNLIDKNLIDHVGVEGAFSTFDFTPFRSFPEVNIVWDVAKEFLDENLIAAPTFAGITSVTNPPLITGIDDHKHHSANVKAYLDSRSTRPLVLKQLKHRLQHLNIQENQTYNAKLLKFDSLKTRFNAGSLELGAYLIKLRALPKEVLADLKLYPMLDLYLSAYEIETRIDFEKVNQDRIKVIQQLSSQLNTEEIEFLTTKSIQYKSGKLNFGAYYALIKDYCEKKGVPLSKTPAFEEFIHYILLSDQIRTDALFTELKIFEKKILLGLITNQDEKLMADQSIQLDLINKLVNFEMTPLDWKEYKALSQTNPLLNPVHNLGPYENFYHEAEIRSQKLVGNFLSRKFYGHKSKLLVTGGFHTSDIATELKRRKISFITITPKITKIETASGSSYLSIFSQDKPHLDNLALKEKLFISPPSVYAVGSQDGIYEADLTARKMRIEIRNRHRRENKDFPPAHQGPSAPSGTWNISTRLTQLIRNRILLSFFNKGKATQDEIDEMTVKDKIYQGIKKGIEKGQTKEGQLFVEWVRHGELIDFQVADEFIVAILFKNLHQGQKGKPVIELIRTDLKGNEVIKNRVLPQPARKSRKDPEVFSLLNKALVFDGNFTYFFIGYGDPESTNPIQHVWVYDVAEGRVLKKYELDLPLESLVGGSQKGKAYGSRSHGENIDHIFEFTVESEETQPSSWPSRGRLVLVERRFPKFRLYQKF
jgi:hypothetical protein